MVRSIHLSGRNPLNAFADYSFTWSVNPLKTRPTHCECPEIGGMLISVMTITLTFIICIVKSYCDSFPALSEIFWIYEIRYGMCLSHSLPYTL